MDGADDMDAHRYVKIRLICIIRVLVSNQPEKHDKLITIEITVQSKHVKFLN
jgi:hypothetical protein